MTNRISVVSIEFAAIDMIRGHQMRLGSTLLCRLIRSTSSQHRPWQIALGVTVGVLLGILPKTSLLCVVLGLVCVVLPAHLPLLILTAVLVSFASPLLQSTLGSIGLWSLTNPNVSAYWLRLDSLPLVPWLGIHNTVVNGSLCAWLVVSVPVYICTRLLSGLLFASAVPDAVANIMLSIDTSSQKSTLQDEQEIRPLAGLREPGELHAPIAPPVVIWDDINHDPSYFEVETEDALESNQEVVSSDQIIRRSADIAAWAEELITEELLMDNRGSYGSTNTNDTNIPEMDVDSPDEERWLIETTMEMVRIAERAVTNQAALKAKQAGDNQGTGSTQSPSSRSQTEENSQIQTVQMQNTLVTDGVEAVFPGKDLQESNIRREQLPHTDHRSHLGQTRGAVGGVNRPREEALHYLLRHLKEVQEKAQKQ